MAVDNVTSSSSTGFDGNAYTTAVSNDTLTNNDFLTLMLEEMKQQDPTKPMDSAALMDSQLKMSTIQSNQDMATAMTALQASYSASALSTASNMIGRSIKTGETDDVGEDKIYQVVTVDNKDGELFVKAQQFTGVYDGLKDKVADKNVQYDANGLISDTDGNPTAYRVALDADNRFKYNADGSIMLLDSDNKVITDTTIKDKYTYGGYSLLYSDDTVEIPLSSITTVS
ncbi:MAG: flagellar hook capping FlgD N-terminal domain-containing protein [Arcobacteraceae bacterium]